MSSKNYDFLISLLPYYLRKNKNVQDYYKVVSMLFDNLDKTLELLSKQNLIDYAEGEFLDDLGTLVEEKRDDDTDSYYRNRIRIAFSKLYFVPHLDNIINLLNKFLNKYPEKITPGWDEEDREPGKYTLDYVADNFFNIDLINRLDELIGGGIRMETNIYQEFFDVFPLTNLSSTDQNYIWRKYVRILVKDGIYGKKIPFTGDASHSDVINKMNYIK